MSIPHSDQATMRVGFRSVDGTRIRYAYSDRDREQTILLTAPWPESVYAFEQIWPRLARHARLVAVDLPSFGQSESRPDLMTPRAMGEFVVQLIDEWQLGKPHFLGPDIGTSVGLSAAASHPGLLSSLVVGCGATAVPLELLGPLKEWVEAPDVERFRAMDARAIVRGALDTIEGYTLPPEVREDYLHSYEGDRFVESMAFARSYPVELPILAEQLPEILTPVQIVAGRRDAVLPVSNAEFLSERLPNSTIALVDAGHFAWEEAADEYGAIVEEWITRDAGSPAAA